MKKHSKKSRRSVGPVELENCKKLILSSDTTGNAIIVHTEQKANRPPKKLNRKSFCIASLRRSSYRWPPREASRKAAKVGRNQYRCAHCPTNRLFGRKDTQIDHIEPVVKLTGWESLDSFAERLLCEINGYQLLCKAHHEIKTKKEKEIRKQYRKILKDKL